MLGLSRCRQNRCKLDCLLGKGKENNEQLLLTMYIPMPIEPTYLLLPIGYACKRSTSAHESESSLP